MNKSKVEVVGFFCITGQASQTSKMKAEALRSYICHFRTHKKLLYLLLYFGSTYIMIRLLPTPKTLKQPEMNGCQGVLLLRRERQTNPR